MQAALMAQAALVRGQVQAQAAFMLNQMNMRQQNSSSVSSSKLSNTMINSKGDLQQMQGLSSTGNSGLGESFLNIWQVNCIDKRLMSFEWFFFLKSNRFDVKKKLVNPCHTQKDNFI